MALIAAFGMYDRPETAGANDRLWENMRAALHDNAPDIGRDAPLQLARGALAYMDGWRSPFLLISQTCSLPYRAKLHSLVNLIAAPDYGLLHCPAGHYRSVYIARKDDCAANLADLAGRDFAYNEALSHSGWAAPYADHAVRGLELHPTLRTGAHQLSALAVAEEKADYAAIDAVSWAQIQAYDRFSETLIAVDYTAITPALPYITARAHQTAPLRAALAQAIAALNAPDRSALHLHGLVEIPASAYLSLPIPPSAPQGV